MSGPQEPGALTRARFGNRPRPAPKTRAWRSTAPPQAPGVETLPLDRASRRLECTLQDYLAAFADGQRGIEAQRDDPDRAIRTACPDLPPLAEQVTTGIGKSAAIRRLIPEAIAAGVGVALVCPTHDAIRTYVDAVPALFHYHGRSAPLSNPPRGRAQPASTCWKMDLVAAISGAHHRPQPTLCRDRCQHGMKRALDNIGSGIFDEEINAERDRIKAWFEARGIPEYRIGSIEPCLWLDQQQAALRSQAIAMPAASFSTTMAMWNPGGDSIIRLVIIDEAVPLGEEITVSLEAVAAWRTAANQRLYGLRQDAGLPDLRDRDRARIAREIEGMMIAIEMCTTLAEYLGAATAQGGTRPVPAWLCDRMREIRDRTKGAWSGGTAPWEKVSWDKLAPVTVPYRAASAILHTLAHDGGHVAEGRLHVVGLSQIGEWLASGKSAILLDATLPAETRAIMAAVGGTIEAIHVRQNLKIRRYPNTLFGRGRQLSGNQSDYTDSSIRRAIEIVMGLPSDRGRALLTHLPWQDSLEAEHDRDPEKSRLSGLEAAGIAIGHFGLDDRAHDRWHGCHLAIVGGPILSPAGWRSEYLVARHTAIAGGADPAGWPRWPTDDEAVERDVWIDEGNGYDVLSRAPLPVDPFIRAWILSRYRETIVQAIGRARAVRHVGDPLVVALYGGLPVDLSPFGIDRVEYRDNPVGWTVEGLNAESRSKADARFETALRAVCARGEMPSRRRIQAEMKASGVPVMDNRGVQRRLREHQESGGVVASDDRRTRGSRS